MHTPEPARLAPPRGGPARGVARMNIERILDNRTLMPVACVPMDDRHGRDVLVVIAKLTWEVSAEGAAAIAVPQRTPRMADVPRSLEAWSSLQYASDLADEKPGTDVLMLGTAHPPPEATPGGKRATERDVTLRVQARHGAVQKTVRVHGPRVYYRSVLGVVPGPAAPLTPTPLVYELACGGRDTADPSRVIHDPRNPVGRGVAADRGRLVGTPAHQLEDPIDPTRPAAFGPIPAHWSPRRERAGTYDAAWQRQRAPLRPFDFDLRHHVTAPPELWSETPLEGDEPVDVLGATPEGLWRFRLPHYAPVFHAIERGESRVCPTHLDTLLIDTDTRTVELTWRVAVPLPRKTEHLQSIIVFASDELPADVRDALRRRLDDAAHEEARA